MNFTLSRNSLLMRYLRVFKNQLFYPTNIDESGNPLDLCSVIRALVVSLFHTVVILFSLFIMLIVVFLPFITLVKYLLNIEVSLELNNLAISVGVIECFFGTCFLIYSYFERKQQKALDLYYKNLLDPNYKFEVKVKKQPSIIIQFLKDKHNKVCTKINLID